MSGNAGPVPRQFSQNSRRAGELRDARPAVKTGAPDSIMRRGGRRIGLRRYGRLAAAGLDHQGARTVGFHPHCTTLVPEPLEALCAGLIGIPSGFRGTRPLRVPRPAAYGLTTGDFGALPARQCHRVAPPRIAHLGHAYFARLHVGRRRATVSKAVWRILQAWTCVARSV